MVSVDFGLELLSDHKQEVQPVFLNEKKKKPFEKLHRVFPERRMDQALFLIPRDEGMRQYLNQRSTQPRDADKFLKPLLAGPELILRLGFGEKRMCILLSYHQVFHLMVRAHSGAPLHFLL